MMEWLIICAEWHQSESIIFYLQSAVTKSSRLLRTEIQKHTEPFCPYT